MAVTKVSGLGAIVTVDDATGTAQVISDDTTNFSFATPRASQDVTGVNKTANQRLLLLADYSATINGPMDTGANQSHAVFSTIPSTSKERNVKIQPTVNATPYLSALCILTDYQITRANTGELTYQVPASLFDGTAPSWS